MEDEELYGPSDVGYPTSSISGEDEKSEWAYEEEETPTLMGWFDNIDHQIMKPYFRSHGVRDEGYTLTLIQQP